MGMYWVYFSIIGWFAFCFIASCGLCESYLNQPFPRSIQEFNALCFGLELESE